MARNLKKTEPENSFESWKRQIDNVLRFLEFMAPRVVLGIFICVTFVGELWFIASIARHYILS